MYILILSYICIDSRSVLLSLGVYNNDHFKRIYVFAPKLPPIPQHYILRKIFPRTPLFLTTWRTNGPPKAPQKVLRCLRRCVWFLSPSDRDLGSLTEGFPSFHRTKRGTLETYNWNIHQKLNGTLPTDPLPTATRAIKYPGFFEVRSVGPVGDFLENSKAQQEWVMRVYEVEKWVLSTETIGFLQTWWHLFSCYLLFQVRLL